MEDRTEFVHVHNLDTQMVIDEYLAKGFVLQETTAPTIAAQPGFVRLVFIPIEFAPVEKKTEKRNLNFFIGRLLGKLEG